MVRRLGPWRLDMPVAVALMLYLFVIKVVFPAMEKSDKVEKEQRMKELSPEEYARRYKRRYGIIHPSWFALGRGIKWMFKRPAKNG